MRLTEKDKLFIELSEGMYEYKRSGILSEKTQNILEILSKDNKDKVDKLLKSIEENNQNFNKEDAKKLVEDINTFSVTSVETYNKCPFKYFIDYGLRPVDDKKEKSFSYGSFYHNAISEISEKLWNKNIDKDEYLNEATIIANNIFDAFVKNNDLIKEELEREREINVERIVQVSYIYYLSLSKGKFKLISNEYKVSKEIKTKNGHNIKLLGIIDRIDEANINGENYARIIDYKTGGKTIRKELMDIGVDIQLPIYATLIQGNLAGMYYASMESPIKDDGKDDKNKYQLKGPTINNIDVLTASDQSIEEENNSSNIIQVSKNKDGSFSKRSNLKEKDEIDKDIKLAMQIFAETVDKIKNGDNAAIPLKQYGINACEYCRYNTICQYNK